MDPELPVPLRVHVSRGGLAPAAGILPVLVGELHQREDLLHVRLTPSLISLIQRAAPRHRLLLGEGIAAGRVDEIEVPGVAGEDRREPAGHRLHRHQVGPTLRPVGEEPEVGIAIERGHRPVGQRAHLHERSRRHTVRHQPLAGAHPARRIDARRSLHVPRRVDSPHRLGPGVVPRRHQQRLGVLPHELPEGGDDDVLALPVLELPAGEDHEPLRQEPGAGRRVKDRGIDPLGHEVHVDEPAILEQLRVPRRPGDDRLEARGAVKCLGGDHGILEEQHPDVVAGLDPGAARVILERPVEPPEDRPGALEPRAALLQQLGEVALFHDRLVEEGLDHRRRPGKVGRHQQGGVPPLPEELKGEVESEDAPAGGGVDRPVDQERRLGRHATLLRMSTGCRVW